MAHARPYEAFGAMLVVMVGAAWTPFDKGGGEGME